MQGPISGKARLAARQQLKDKTYRSHLHCFSDFTLSLQSCNWHQQHSPRLPAVCTASCAGPNLPASRFGNQSLQCSSTTPATYRHQQIPSQGTSKCSQVLHPCTAIMTQPGQAGTSSPSCVENSCSYCMPAADTAVQTSPALCLLLCAAATTKATSPVACGMHLSGAGMDASGWDSCSRRSVLATTVHQKSQGRTKTPSSPCTDTNRARNT